MRKRKKDPVREARRQHHLRVQSQGGVPVLTIGCVNAKGATTQFSKLVANISNIKIGPAANDELIRALIRPL